LSIRVCGSRLIDAAGNVVQLHGVNVSGLESVAVNGYDPTNPWGAQTGTNTPDWNLIKTWHSAGTNVVNAVRLPLNEASWLGLSCTDLGGGGVTINSSGNQVADTPGQVIRADPGGNYQATVQASVAAATAAGLYVILDLHWAAPKDGANEACPMTQNAMADADYSVAFWTSLASAFKGNPAVIFELFNEPFLDAVSTADNGSPWSDLLNGGGIPTQFLTGGGSGPGEVNLNWTTAGMQQMLNAVRATGATNVVLTSPLQWAQSMDQWLAYKPTDPAGQLGAVWHAYSQSGTDLSCSDAPVAQCWALIKPAVQRIIAAGFPVVITEFGDTITNSPGNSAPFASQLLPFADANGLSYLGWTWDNWQGFSQDVLITDAQGDPTNGYGTYVKQHYLCVSAGTANCP
jgi:hypothetical protein